jgi:T-complex protein 1 subunit delta
MATTQQRSFGGREKQKDIRHSNMVAAKAVADLVRTSLGPKGMDKMIVQANDEVIITNDGATILQKIDILHPAAKMLVDLSKAQDVEAGDGTTTVVVICGALLTAAMALLDKGIHPSTISEAWLIGQAEASKILQDMAIPLQLSDNESLVKAAITSLNSKVISSHSKSLAPLAVDAVMKICPDLENEQTVDLDDIKIVKKLGGTIEDTQLVEGVLFEKGASHTAGGPTFIQNAKIGLIEYCLSAPKTNMENSVVVQDYSQIDRLLKEERKYILGRLKPIVKSGCNVLLIQKSILRDAVNDLALSFLAKYKIMVIKDIERTDVEFIANTLGLTPVADDAAFSADKLGHADVAAEIPTPGGSVVKITGVKNPGKTVSVLVRGSNRLLLDEADRSVHDALCVIRSLLKQRYLIPGGGAPEIELSIRLAKLADSMGGMAGYCIREYAKALEVIPYTLSENAGLNPIKTVTELRNRHANGEKYTGINVRKGCITDIRDENVLQPLLVTTSAMNLATETVRMILKIDDIVAIR